MKIPAIGYSFGLSLKNKVKKICEDSVADLKNNWMDWEPTVSNLNVVSCVYDSCHIEVFGKGIDQCIRAWRKDCRDAVWNSGKEDKS